MLTKLLKYEFKATGRAFLPLYGALLALALVNNLLLRLDGARFMQTHELSRISAAVGVMAYVLLIMAALQNIPASVYEAAEMDDTPRWRTFFKITLPMISPTILFTTVVATIASFKVFDSISIMTGGGPLNATNTLVYYIYDYAYSYGKPGQACAAGVVLLFFVCVVTWLQFRVSKKNVHYQ